MQAVCKLISHTLIAPISILHQHRLRPRQDPCPSLPGPVSLGSPDLPSSDADIHSQTHLMFTITCAHCAPQVWADTQAAGLVPDCRLCITYIEAATRLGLTDKALQMYCQVGGTAVTVLARYTHSMMGVGCTQHTTQQGLEQAADPIFHVLNSCRPSTPMPCRCATPLPTRLCRPLCMCTRRPCGLPLRVGAGPVPSTYGRT